MDSSIKNNDIIPGRISKLLIKKDHYTKKATAPTKKEQIETAARKNKFSPISTTQETYFNQPKMFVRIFMPKLKDFYQIVPLLSSWQVNGYRKKKVPMKGVSQT